MTLSEATALIGATFGVAGFALALGNYFRDRHKVIVRLQWDLNVTDNPTYDSSKRWGLITITNVGRRPVFVGHVALHLPQGSSPSHWIQEKGIRGTKIGEGDIPLSYVISQDGLGQYSKRWREVVAQVSDSTGKEWVSRKISNRYPPSWAHTDGLSKR